MLGEDPMLSTKALVYFNNFQSSGSNYNNHTLGSQYYNKHIQYLINLLK